MTASACTAAVSLLHGVVQEASQHSRVKLESRGALLPGCDCGTALGARRAPEVADTAALAGALRRMLAANAGA